MGSLLILLLQVAGLALFVVGVGLMWFPLAFVVGGIAIFGFGWLLDGDDESEEVE